MVNLKINSKSSANRFDTGSVLKVLEQVAEMRKFNI